MSANSFYSPEELAGLGLGSYGKNVLISRKASFYSPHKMHFGDDVRIDDFCMLSGKVTLGNNVHIGAGALIYGGGAGVYVGDYVVVSSRCAVYALSDDLGGDYLISPMVPYEYTSVTETPVRIGRLATVGTGCTIMPGADVGEGTALGACSLLLKSAEPWGIYYGVPAKRHGERSRKMAELAEQYEQSKKAENG